MHGLTRSPVWLALSQLRWGGAARPVQLPSWAKATFPIPLFSRAGKGGRSGTALQTSLCSPIPREYWMNYRGAGFLADVWFGFSPPPPHSQSASCISFSVFLVPSRAYWRGGIAKIKRRRDAWSSINFSLFYAHSQSTFICTGTIYTHEQFNPIVSCTQIGPYQFTLSPHCPPSPPPQ
jgi:hypothetical protein